MERASSGPHGSGPEGREGDLPELLLVGRLVAPQGLRGDIRTVPLSDFPERFTVAGPRWLRRPACSPQPVELLRGRRLPGRELYVLHFAGIDDRSAARELVGAELLVSATDRPPLAPGEFHLLDLVGLRVRLLPEGSTPIGRVTDLIHAGNDLLEVELDNAPGGERTPRRRLIPFVKAIVPVVNLEEGWIGLTPPPGLLEL